MSITMTSEKMLLHVDIASSSCRNMALESTRGTMLVKVLRKQGMPAQARQCVTTKLHTALRPREVSVDKETTRFQECIMMRGWNSKGVCYKYWNLLTL